MPVRTSYAGAAISGEVLTAANVNRVAGGWIGYEQVTTNQTGITTEVDLTGITVGPTIGTSRRIRVTVELVYASTVASDVVAVRIKEGATTLQDGSFHLGTAAGASSKAVLSVVLTPTAGAHTYKATMVRAVGTGSLNTAASATNPSYILVEDLGPAT